MCQPLPYPLDLKSFPMRFKATGPFDREETEAGRGKETHSGSCT